MIAPLSEAVNNIPSASLKISQGVTNELHQFQSNFLDPLARKVGGLEDSIQMSLQKNQDRNVLEVSPAVH